MNAAARRSSPACWYAKEVTPCWYAQEKELFARRPAVLWEQQSGCSEEQSLPPPVLIVLIILPDQHHDVSITTIKAGIVILRISNRISIVSLFVFNTNLIHLKCNSKRNQGLPGLGQETRHC
jgi:hypothetical protein